MKYAFMTFSCPELSLDEVLAVAQKYGYDGIEPRIDSDQRHGVERATDAAARRTIKQKAADSGIALCCVATSCNYADPETVREKVEVTQQAIDLAADVGAPRIRVFGGTIPDGRSREQAIDGVARALKSVADHAQERGVTVCMETHDDWCDPKHMAEVMRRVDHPAIAVNWDIMHPVRRAGVTMDEAFEALKPWIRHIHFHDGVKLEDGGIKLATIGQGMIDHRRAVQLLKAMPYDGFLSGEWIRYDEYDKHLPRELAIMKNYEAET